MLFNSYEFIFLFLPITLLGFISILLFSTIGLGKSRVGEYWALRLPTVSAYIFYFIVTLLACRYKEENY